MLKNILRLFGKKGGRVEDMLAFPEGKRIYREFHTLRRESMDQDALKVINRLNRHGHRSYLVGGCVRDLLLGRRPKDYDIVTTATPPQIRKIFTNSRSIGRRFKIVHVIFRGGKIIEVSTFRSLPEHRLDGKVEQGKDYMLKRDNRYGNPREDAARRDFSINALFFDPRNESIIDYVNGFKHLEQKKISVIGDPDISFKEDPVRMLRAAKFSALLGFEIDRRTRKGIQRQNKEIQKASPARLLEEYYKIFRTGKAAEIMAAFDSVDLFRAMFAEACQVSDLGKKKDFFESSIGKRLQAADKMLLEREELTTVIYLALIFQDLVKGIFGNDSISGNVQDYVKKRLTPICQRMQIPARDKDRILQIFMAQDRFIQKRRRTNSRPDHFRNKIFFYESFYIYKLQAITSNDAEAIQNSMFWEVGLRMRPPEPSRLVTTFHPRKRSRAELSGDGPSTGRRGARPRRRDSSAK